MYHKLLELQQPILDKTGKFVVRACPGSGKTYCVAAKLSKLIEGWDSKHQGVAVISFTNTAWQEIGKKCKDDFNTELSYPHFLGTIDSFINQFIFLPFGHLALGCSTRPILVGEPYGIWSGGLYDRDPKKHFDKCTFDINGSLIATADVQSFGFSWKKNSNGSTNGNVINLENEKKTLNSKGYATQADANYFAMKILENPNLKPILQSLAHKYSWLIIDEAQDTSDIQMRIIDLLIEAGVSNVMIVGDPDKAIFEWNNAKPQLFEDKYIAWKDNSLELYESHRSSKPICDVVHKLSSPNKQQIIPSKTNEVKDFTTIPEVWVYDKNDKQATIDKFIQECKNINITPTHKNTVVLSRSGNFFSKVPNVNPPIDPWVEKSNFTREFMKGKYLYDNKRILEGLKYIERASIKIGLKKETSISQLEIDDYILQKGGIIKFRNLLQNLVNKLPITDISLGEWVKLANETLNNPKLAFKINIAANDLTFEHVFPIADTDFQEEEYKVATIHKVKGETYDATLLFVKKSAGNSAHYKNIFKVLEGNTLGKTEEELNKYREEARIIYVAISRPKKLLIIATEDEDCQKTWKDKLGLK
jgi:DNA helicase II / ATP-dependent DNA helicase PcrA